MKGFPVLTSDLMKQGRYDWPYTKDIVPVKSSKADKKVSKKLVLRCTRQFARVPTPPTSYQMAFGKSQFFVKVVGGDISTKVEGGHSKKQSKPDRSAAAYENDYVEDQIHVTFAEK